MFDTTLTSNDLCFLAQGAAMTLAVTAVVGAGRHAARHPLRRHPRPAGAVLGQRR